MEGSSVQAPTCLEETRLIYFCSLLQSAAPQATGDSILETREPSSTRHSDCIAAQEIPTD